MVASIPRAVATKRGVSAALMVNMATRSGSTPTDLSNCARRRPCRARGNCPRDGGTVPPAAGHIDPVSTLGEGGEQMQGETRPVQGTMMVRMWAQRGARVARGVGGAVGAFATEEGDDAALAIRRIGDHLGNGHPGCADLGHAD